MRRLYSTFAGSWPGAGLLLLRMVVGSVVLVSAASKLWAGAALPTTLSSAFLAGSGVLLMAGLWTPVAGTLVAVLEVAQILNRAPDFLVCLLVGTAGGALAMLGPGRWSVDAQLFGWKRIDLGEHARNGHAETGQHRPPPDQLKGDREAGPGIP